LTFLSALKPDQLVFDKLATEMMEDMMAASLRAKAGEGRLEPAGRGGSAEP
jgi:hypothetical protein